MIAKSLKFIISKGGSIKLNIFNIKTLRERSLQKKNEKLLLAYPTAESRVEYLSKKFPTLCFRQDMANRVIALIAIDSLFLKFAKGSLRDIQITPSHLPLTEHEAYLELKFLSRKNLKRPDISGKRSSRLNDIIVSIEDVKSTELKSPLEKIAQIYSESIYRVYQYSAKEDTALKGGDEFCENTVKNT